MPNPLDAADDASKKEEPSSVDLYPPIPSNETPRAEKRVPAQKPSTVVTTTLSLEEVPKEAAPKQKRPRVVKSKVACAEPPAEPVKQEVLGAKAGSTAFGWVELNGTRYDHDVVVRADGTVVQRDKSLSRGKKAKYGHLH